MSFTFFYFSTVLQRNANKQHYSKNKNDLFISCITFFNQILILAAVRQSMHQVCGAYLCGIAPVGKFEEMLQQWQAIGNTVTNLTGPRFEPQASCSRDKRVTARPTGIVVDNFLLTIIFTFSIN